MATETYIPRFRNAHCLLTNLLDSPLGMLVSLYFKREKNVWRHFWQKPVQGGPKPCFLLWIVIGFLKVVPYSLETKKFQLKPPGLGFPGGAVVENLPANAGDTGSSPGLGGSHMPRSNQAREP